ncbi:MAG: adaptor protein MecA [Lachnospiraceae bacterium]|nr:adaptor protein MecA [Lachnospiraceae bacterium]
MNFRKVSDRELRCSVSVEEIRAKGLEVSDLLKRSEKTYEFFEYLVQEGQEETGFEKSGPMSVEGIFLNGTLELIFRSVDEDEAGEWEERENEEEYYEAPMPSLPDIDPENGEVLKLVQVRFASAGLLYRFCQLLPFAEKVPSSLYQADGSYVLILDLDNCTRSEIGAFCMLANEYGAQSTYGDLQASQVMEHGRHVCDDAVYHIHEMKPMEQ